MSVTVDDKIRKLNPARRRNVETRAPELAAEEMTRRELRTTALPSPRPNRRRNSLSPLSNSRTAPTAGCVRLSYRLVPYAGSAGVPKRHGFVDGIAVDSGFSACTGRRDAVVDPIGG
jgi:hypothetical protein